MKNLVILVSVLGLVLAESAISYNHRIRYSSDQIAEKNQYQQGYSRYTTRSSDSYRMRYQRYQRYQHRGTYPGDYYRTGYSRRAYSGDYYRTGYSRRAGYSRHESYPSRSYQSSRAAFSSRVNSTGGRLFIFSPRMRAWAAYSPDGKLVRTGRASGGRGYCPDIGRSCRTPQGSYRIHSLGSAGCRSTIYPKPRGGAPMPYCMFYSKYYAVHGSYDVPNYNASHGCIRVTPSDAAWLRYNFMTIGTRVRVTSY